MYIKFQLVLKTLLVILLLTISDYGGGGGGASVVNAENLLKETQDCVFYGCTCENNDYNENDEGKYI